MYRNKTTWPGCTHRKENTTVLALDTGKDPRGAGTLRATAYSLGSRRHKPEPIQVLLRCFSFTRFLLLPAGGLGQPTPPRIMANTDIMRSSGKVGATEVNPLHEQATRGEGALSTSEIAALLQDRARSRATLVTVHDAVGKDGGTPTFVSVCVAGQVLPSRPVPLPPHPSTRSQSPGPPTPPSSPATCSSPLGGARTPRPTTPPAAGAHGCGRPPRPQSWRSPWPRP